MVITSVLFLGFGLWCIYDGMVTYPKSNEGIRAFRELQQEGRLEEYAELAEENGWPADPSHAEIKSEWDIRTQFIMAAPCLLFSFFSLFRLFTSLPRSMATDENGLKTISGEIVPYGQIRRIDKTKWDRKGIADIFYEDASKSKGLRRTRVDAWIFAGGEDVLRDVEARADAAEIVGGTPFVASESESDDASETEEKTESAES